VATKEELVRDRAPQIIRAVLLPGPIRGPDRGRHGHHQRSGEEPHSQGHGRPAAAP
jgi:hypothetical protein